MDDIIVEQNRPSRLSTVYGCFGERVSDTAQPIENSRMNNNNNNNNITGDARETTYLFQQLSIALQRGNAVSFQSTFTTS